MIPTIGDMCAIVDDYRAAVARAESEANERIRQMLGAVAPDEIAAPAELRALPAPAEPAGGRICPECNEHEIKTAGAQRCKWCQGKHARAARTAKRSDKEEPLSPVPIEPETEAEAEPLELVELAGDISRRPDEPEENGYEGQSAVVAHALASGINTVSLARRSEFFIVRAASGGVFPVAKPEATDAILELVVRQGREWFYKRGGGRLVGPVGRDQGVAA